MTGVKPGDQVPVMVNVLTVKNGRVTYALGGTHVSSAPTDLFRAAAALVSSPQPEPGWYLRITDDGRETPVWYDGERWFGYHIDGLQAAPSRPSGDLTRLVAEDEW